MVRRMIDGLPTNKYRDVDYDRLKLHAAESKIKGLIDNYVAIGQLNDIFNAHYYCQLWRFRFKTGKTSLSDTHLLMLLF